MKIATALGFMLMLAPVTSFAQDTPNDEADAKRLDAILVDAAQGARTFRLTGAWTTFGLGAAETIGGGVVLGTLKDDSLRTALGVELLVLGGVGMALSLPSFLLSSETERLAARTKRDLADPRLSMRERVANAVAGLRTAADAEESRRVLQIVAGSIGLALATGGEVFVLAVNDLTSDYRAAFATLFAGLGALDLALLVDVILTRPASRALERWERGDSHASAIRWRPIVSPTGLGLVATF